VREHVCTETALDLRDRIRQSGCWSAHPERSPCPFHWSGLHRTDVLEDRGHIWGRQGHKSCPGICRFSRPMAEVVHHRRSRGHEGSGYRSQGTPEVRGLRPGCLHPPGRYRAVRLRPLLRRSRPRQARRSCRYSVAVSTDKIGGRCCAIRAHVRPSSALPQISPLVVPKYTPAGSSRSVAIPSRITS